MQSRFVYKGFRFWLLMSTCCFLTRNQSINQSNFSTFHTNDPEVSSASSPAGLCRSRTFTSFSYLWFIFKNESCREASVTFASQPHNRISLSCSKCSNFSSAINVFHGFWNTPQMYVIGHLSKCKCKCIWCQYMTWMCEPFAYNPDRCNSSHTEAVIMSWNLK